VIKVEGVSATHGLGRSLISRFSLITRPDKESFRELHFRPHPFKPGRCSSPRLCNSHLDKKVPESIVPAAHFLCRPLVLQRSSGCSKPRKPIRPSATTPCNLKASRHLISQSSVLALGNWLNSRIKILRDFNIPEPVTSGLLVCVVTALLYAFIGLEISFTLATRDFLLLYFFASIGLNSDIKTLWAGGIPLLILVALTIGYMLLQNLTGIAVATSLGLDSLVGLLGGSVSLLGGHGTSIAWAPTFAEEYGIPNASEIGVSCATLGLVISSLIGGPSRAS
jgi:Sodium/glutamate symporter